MKINKNSLIYMMSLFPILVSQVVYTIINSKFATFLLVLKMFVFIYYFGKKVIRHYISVLDMAVGMYFVVWGISVFINEESIVEYAKESIVICTLIFMVEEAKHTDIKAFFDALTLMLFSLFLINFVVAIIVPNGLWQTMSIYGTEADYMFLGLGNQLTPMFLIALMTALFQYEIKNIKFVILYGIVLLGNVYFMSSATAIVGSCVMLGIFIITKTTGKYKIPKIAMAIVVVVGISIVIFRIQYIFSFIIENILGKTLTLSSRTIIWDKALALIGKEPIIGYGAGTLATVIQDRNSHCFFLQILIQSGIIGLLCYINVFRVVLKKCKKYSKLKSYIIINSCICGYLTCCITEVYSQNFLILILCIAFIGSNLETVIQESSNNIS